MSKMLKISDDVYQSLKLLAKNQGRTPSAWVSEKVKTDAVKLTRVTNGKVVGKSKPRTFADLVAGRYGGIRGKSETNYSENTGKQFADAMEEKRKAGHF